MWARRLAEHGVPWVSQAHYDNTKEVVSRWTPQVKANREAPHISFSAEASENTRHVITVSSLMHSFQPSTPLEVEMAAAFNKVSQATQGKEGFPEEDAVSFEEFCKRQNEMAKLKALMSYHDLVRAQQRLGFL